MRAACAAVAILAWGACDAARAQPPASSAEALKAAAFASRDVEWRSGEVRLRRPGNAVDSLRVDIGAPARAPLGPAPRILDITLTRSWPEAFALAGPNFALDVSPHAGLGFGSSGGQAEAGALLRVSRAPLADKAVARLRAMGVADGAGFGDRGRWYLFAAASGRAVGLNVLHDGARWDRAGWSIDPTTALVGDAQVGVGWRKGAMQSSFGLIHREVKGQHMIFGQHTRDDTLAAFSFSLKPGR